MQPIVFFDLESSGTDIATDRICSISLKKTDFSGFVTDEFYSVVNPGFLMKPEVIAIHGITNEMAAAAPKFSEIADTIHSFLDGCDLGGYNLLNFDVPLLWEELNRAGIVWDTTHTRVIDVGNIFKKKEERTLSAAVRFYCGREMEGAHNAAADVDATIDVFLAQLTRYSLPQDAEQLAEFSRFDNRIDLAGKIVRNEQGEAVYNIGKSKGVRVKDDPGFGVWMLSNSFTENTKEILRQILK